MSYKYKIGSDPELFVRGLAQNGDEYFVSAHTLLPGTKESPHFVEGGAVQVDGVAAEFNTLPVSSADDFVEVVNIVRSEMDRLVQEGLEKASAEDFMYLDWDMKKSKFDLSATPTAEFKRMYFFSLPQAVRRLGCTPDFNAWKRDMNPPPNAGMQAFRTGGGHLHLSWQEKEADPYSAEHLEICADLVKQLDTILFPKSLLWDSDTRRRQLYGNVGAFRPKFYGVEYRPLSNAWTANDDLIREVFNTCEYALRLYFEDGKKAWEMPEYRDQVPEEYRSAA